MVMCIICLIFVVEYYQALKKKKRKYAHALFGCGLIHKYFDKLK